jgi:putative transposase
VVFIPKCRRKSLYVGWRKHLQEVFGHLAEQKESRIEEGHLMSDHVPMLVSIPPQSRCRRSWGLLRARARFTWRGFTERGSGALWDNTFGQRGYRSRRTIDWIS